MENNIAIEVTQSGTFKTKYRTPDGNYHRFPRKEIGDAVWSSFESVKCTINALCIEKFYQETFPTVEVTCKRKNVSKLYEWFWKGSDSSKVYDVSITKTGEKTVTVLKMSSGNVMIVDEDISVFENALNSVMKR